MGDGFQKPVIGISSCLLGELVRYDGRIRSYSDLIDELGAIFQFVSFCPEVAAGLSIPREPMDLFVINNKIRMLTINSKIDITPSIEKVVHDMLQEYMNLNISGFVFKSKSPSCGLYCAKMHIGNRIEKNGTGIFAEAFKKMFRNLPVATEIDLGTRLSRKQFITAVQTVYLNR